MRTLVVVAVVLIGCVLLAHGHRRRGSRRRESSESDSDSDSVSEDGSRSHSGHGRGSGRRGHPVPFCSVTWFDGEVKTSVFTAAVDGDEIELDCREGDVCDPDTPATTEFKGDEAAFFFCSKTEEDGDLGDLPAPAELADAEGEGQDEDEDDRSGRHGRHGRKGRRHGSGSKECAGRSRLCYLEIENVPETVHVSECNDTCVEDPEITVYVNTTNGGRAKVTSFICPKPARESHETSEEAEGGAAAAAAAAGAAEPLPDNEEEPEEGGDEETTEDRDESRDDDRSHRRGRKGGRKGGRRGGRKG